MDQSHLIRPPLRDTGPQTATTGVAALAAQNYLSFNLFFIRVEWSKVQQDAVTPQMWAIASPRSMYRCPCISTYRRFNSSSTYVSERTVNASIHPP